MKGQARCTKCGTSRLELRSGEPEYDDPRRDFYSRKFSRYIRPDCIEKITVD
jgi:hypothetical protein